VQSFACSDVQDLKQCVVQVKELRTALDDEREYHRKLEEVLAVEKEKCESWEVNCKKLEEQIVLAKSTMKEHDARIKLSEESDQEYHRKLEEVIAIEKEKCESWEINCKKLEEQIVLAKSTVQEEHDARMKLSEEIQQLNEMLEQSRADIAQTPHAEHILVLEGKQQELEEYVLKLEADCTNKEEAASLAEKQVEKLQMQLSNAMDVEESLLSELDNAGMKIKILNFEVDELQAQLDKVSSEKKDLRLQIAELNSRIEEVNSQLEHSMKELNLAQDKGAHLEKENDDYFTQNLKLEVGLDAACDRMEVFKGRWEDAEVDMLVLKERQQNAESSLAVARLEVKELHVQLENLR
jgi:chromosome segregation ATPase